jgi:hypothetical protein
VKRIWVALAALILFGASAPAASLLKSTMHRWKGDLHSAETMLQRDKMDPAEWRRIFAGFSADARDLSVQLGASTAERRDMVVRFGRLSAAADKLASPGSADRAEVAALRGQCQSCHDLYSN